MMMMNDWQNANCCVCMQ